MKTKILTLTAIICATGASFASAEDSGAISFNGQLVNQTCTVAVNGVNSPAIAAVTLPSVSTSSLAAPGQTTGRTNFIIQLTGCAGASTTAAALFNAGPSVDPASGNLRVATGDGAATGLELQLLDGDAVIKAGSTNQRATATRGTIVNGAVNLPYGVQYLATGASTAGLVSSSVTYSIEYQ